jgi:hypothetical protein
MIKAAFIFSVAISVPATLFSQNRTEDFVITLPQQKVAGPLYNTLSYLDSREDSSNMGIVQLGAFNKKARVVPQIPFAIQLQNVFSALTDSSSNKAELLFQLRQLSFAEITGAMSEKGYCYLRAALYSKNQEHYQIVNTIDTVILIKSMDVTRALFRHGSKTITDFIAAGLLMNSSGANDYSYADIIQIDSIEKRKIPLYNAASYTDGLYTNFESFAAQKPDKPVNAELKNGRLVAVKSPDENGRPIKIKPGDIYAVVFNGQPFIATEFGYYLLQKSGDDFFFTGKAKVNAKTGDVVAASLFFGIIGGLIASDAASDFDMKLDHLNGGFIRLREIKNTSGYGVSP